MKLAGCPDDGLLATTLIVCRHSHNEQFHNLISVLASLVVITCCQ